MYHVTVNGRQEFDLDIQDLEDLDLIQNLDGSYNFIYKGHSNIIRIVEMNERSPSIKLEMNGRLFHLDVETPLARQISALGLDEVGAADGEEVKAPMPGKVLKLLVEPNQTVEAGDDLLILEAMKMENVIKASAGGVVSEIQVEEGAAVDKNAMLLNISSPS